MPRLASGWLRLWSRRDISINIQFKGYFWKIFMTACFGHELSPTSEDTA